MQVSSTQAWLPSLKDPGPVKLSNSKPEGPDQMIQNIILLRSPETIQLRLTLNSLDRTQLLETLKVYCQTPGTGPPRFPSLWG